MTTDHSRFRLWALSTLVAVSSLALALPASAARIKEVAAVEGVRTNQLTGFGLVVGLDGTGDQTTQMPYTSQGLSNYLQQMGISLPAAGAAQLQLKNVAAVLVTAQLPAFARPGQAMDVNVSSLGNSKSLKGGMLITTALRGVDGEVYALAQGNLIVGGAGASAGGSKVQINHLSAGRIPGGGQVERSVPTPLLEGDTISLGLSASDFQTAQRVAQAINRRFGQGYARALDGRTVEVRAPVDPNARVSFIAEMEELALESSVPAAQGRGSTPGPRPWSRGRRRELPATVGHWFPASARPFSDSRVAPRRAHLRPSSPGPEWGKQTAESP